MESPAGRGKVVIRPDREVWPCQLMPRSAGNVRDAPLADILASPVFDDILAQAVEYEAKDKTGCGTGCACTFIMHNVEDAYAKKTMPYWRGMELSVPDEIGERIQRAIAEKRQARADA